MRKLNLILSILVLVAFFFTGCTKEVEKTTTEKKTEKVTNQVQVPQNDVKNPGGETAGNKESSKDVAAYFGDNLLKYEGENTIAIHPKLLAMITDYDLKQDVYVACGENDRYSNTSGNGWLRGQDTRGTWSLWKVNKNTSDGIPRVQMPELLMFNLVQFEETPDGFVEKRWGQYQSLFGHKQVYNNQSGANARVGLFIYDESVKFKPELINGKPVPQDVTGQPLRKKS